MGAAIPTRDGTWRRLGGDEIGWLLADHILRHTEGDDRLVVTTLVSSSMLAAIAADHGVHSVETFTGFKWIAHTVAERPEQRFVFGYEQALGYLVAGRPLDKDGITAAVLLAEVAALAHAEGTDLEARLTGLAERYGRHVMVERSVRMDPADGSTRWPGSGRPLLESVAGACGDLRRGVSRGGSAPLGARRRYPGAGASERNRSRR